MAAFREIWTNAGVDEKGASDALMFVPVGGWNILQLVGGPDLDVSAVDPKKAIDVASANSDGRIRKVAGLYDFSGGMLRAGLQQPNVLRFFKITAHRPTLQVLVKAKTPGGTTVAQVTVAAANERTVKLAIRLVMVKDGKGDWVPHSKNPFEPEKWVEQMNRIWIPQANVKFNLVSREPLRSPNPLPDVIDLSADVFKPLPEAGLTMFRVKDALGEDRRPGVNGVTIPEKACSAICDRADDLTMAHEAGHWLGYDTDPQGKWQHFRHSEGNGELMTEKREGPKIPWSDVVAHFNHPQHHYDAVGRLVISP